MNRSALFSPVALPTLRHNIGEQLSAAIFSGRLKPGDRLNESQLARELKVSRAPIREALQLLHEQGLVVNHPRRGMFVVHLEEEDIQKINSVRLILEAEAMRLCRDNLTSKSSAKLAQILDRLEATENATPSVRVKLDFEFHRALWALSGNEYLERTLAGLTAPLFAFGVLRSMKMDKVRHIIYSHRPLLKFVQGKGDEPAETVLADHLRVPWNRPERFSSLALSTD